MTADPAGATATCPTCRALAEGKFCSNCGAALTGARCVACDAPLTPGASFCHRCGAKAGSAAEGKKGSVNGPGIGNALPWSVAAIALVALIALLAGQRFRGAGSDASDESGAPVAAAQAGAAPDISRMTPEQRAERLYDRVMALSERGRTDSVQLFAPMAIAAYEMIGSLNADQRYDLGRIGAVSGDAELASAQADTILRAQPTHLLGLLLGADAASMRRDESRARDLSRRFVTAAPAERAKGLQEYTLHANDIDAALARLSGGTTRDTARGAASPRRDR